jgi:hypothetical protein
VFKEEIIEKNDRNFVIEGGTPCIEEREKGEREGRPQGGKEKREQVGSRNNIHKSYV